MREITSHIVNPANANDKLKITVLDEPGQGGACHAYEITGYDASTNPSLNELYDPETCPILLQNGPIAEVGVNGVTHEALLAILIDHLESFQSGPYACPENQGALHHLVEARNCLHVRTKERMLRGVEGMNEK